MLNTAQRTAARARDHQHGYSGRLCSRCVPDGERIHADEMLSQTKAADQWAQYQAEMIRERSYEVFLDRIDRVLRAKSIPRGGGQNKVRERDHPLQRGNEGRSNTGVRDGRCCRGPGAALKLV